MRLDLSFTSIWKIKVIFEAAFESAEQSDLERRCLASSLASSLASGRAAAEEIAQATAKGGARGGDGVAQSDRTEATAARDRLIDLLLRRRRGGVQSVHRSHPLWRGACLRRSRLDTSLGLSMKLICAFLAQMIMCADADVYFDEVE